MKKTYYKFKILLLLLFLFPILYCVEEDTKIVYVDQIGQKTTKPRHGGSGGNPKDFKLAPGEYIIEVGGKYGRFIDSFWIKTNQGKTEKWGGGGGNVNFTYHAPPGTRIFGFFGRSGVFLDSIGVIMRTP